MSIYDGSGRIHLYSKETSYSNKCNNSSTHGVYHARCREKHRIINVEDET